MYIMNKLNYSDTERERLNRSDVNIECQWITIKQEHLRKIIICNVYHPAGGCPCEFVECLTKSVNGLTDGTVESMC